MAVAMATVGGMGVIHYNNSLEEQLHQVGAGRECCAGSGADLSLAAAAQRMPTVAAPVQRKALAGMPTCRQGDNGNL